MTDDLFADPPILYGVDLPGWIDAYSRFSAQPAHAQEVVNDIFRDARAALKREGHYHFQLDVLIPLAYAGASVAREIRPLVHGLLAEHEPLERPQNFPGTEDDWAEHRRTMHNYRVRWRSVLQELDTLYPNS